MTDDYQRDLFDPPLGTPEQQRRFVEFDEAHPEVWEMFVRFTHDRIRRGFEHYSSDAILHRIRWETAVSMGDESEFKLNNNFTPYYARKFHRVFPQHDGFFRTRRSRFDREAA
jgi:hypothetical protein